MYAWADAQPKLVVIAGHTHRPVFMGSSHQSRVEEELERLLSTTWYRRVPQLLIDLANERGGDDNITVVIVYAGNDRSKD